MTKSKKLWSSYEGGRFQAAVSGADAEVCVMHDARLAHEMLPVLRLLADALVAVNRTDLASVEGALAAAAPFLEQED